MAVRNISAGAEKVIHVAGSVVGIAGIVLVVGMMLLTVADVFLRAAFNRPIVGSTEVTQLMLVTLSFLAIVFCTMRRSHVKVDILSNHLPSKVQLINDTVFLFLGLVLYWTISWNSFKEAKMLGESGHTTDILEIPVHPFYQLIGVCCGILGLLLLTYMLSNIIKVFKK